MTVNQDTPPTFGERRKHPRFKVSSIAFAACWPNPVFIAQIIDISRTGIAVKYGVDQSLTGVVSDVGILLSGAGFIVNKSPFKSVSDTELIGHPTSRIMMRRHSGYFLKPSSPELERFIAQHKVGRV